MFFGGLQKSSLIDYPGKLSSVIFLSGCNFDCPYCHNPGLVNGCRGDQQELIPDWIFNFLETRKGFLDGVVISGGEPTLQGDLPDLCSRIKVLGYPVKLDTNGSRPAVLQHLIAEGLVDYIAMDLKTDPLHYSLFVKKDYDPAPILSSIQTIMKSGVDYEFRTTCVKPMVTSRIVENIARLIQGAQLYALQRFRNKDVLHPDFFEGNNFDYDDEELAYLKGYVQKWVRQCVVR